MSDWFDEYYSTCFYKNLKINHPLKTLSFYDACFGWCLPIDKNTPILDFGAGLGNLMFWLRQRGFTNVHGVDISKEQCEMAQKISGVTVEHISNPLEYLRIHREKFGLVFMSDVIEHIPKVEMVEILKAIYYALIPGGSLVIKTDNISSPTGIYQLYMDFTHEYCFTESTLEQLLRICKYENISIKGEPMPIPKRPWHWWKPLVRILYWFALRIIYEAEQPRGDRNPKIFAKSLIARCYRPLN